MDQIADLDGAQEQRDLNEEEVILKVSQSIDLEDITKNEKIA